jgi:hypothetical protein
MLVEKNPDTWEDLQNCVGQIFKDIGFYTFIGEDFKRRSGGTVNLDVWGKDVTLSPSLNYICECKQWNTRVPQEKVDAFRTVMLDVGAHCGFIISKKGFQEGAESSADGTNIYIYTWEEFQEYFNNRWVEAMIKKGEEIIKEIQEYMTGDRSNDLAGDEHRLEKILKVSVEAYAVGTGWNTQISRIRDNQFPLVVYSGNGSILCEMDNKRAYFVKMYSILNSIIDKFKSI